MKYLFLLVLTLTFSVNSYADFSRCITMFPKSVVPKIALASNTKHTRELCFDSFAVLYSVDSKAPVYSLEKLNYLRIGKKEPRTNHFHEEPMLGISERATLRDFKGSGYDRGHMAPAGDMPNPVAMEESFSLCNMILQSSQLNRGSWAKSVEAPTRKYVSKRAKGNVFVFTGPYFSPNHKTIGPSHVWVPDYVFKLVYDEESSRAWVYWLPNEDSAQMTAPISYQEFVQKTGLKLLDGFPVK